MSSDYTIELQRTETISRLQSYATVFAANSSPTRAAYIGGPAGCGKTFLVRKAFSGPQWECIFYDCGIVKSKDLIGKLTSTYLGSAGVLSLLQRRRTTQVVCLDNVSALIGGDKTGSNALIRLVRGDRTRRRAGEPMCPNFIVCIGGSKEDKKTKELKKHSEVIMLDAPSHETIGRIVRRISTHADPAAITRSVNRDLRRLSRVVLYESHPRIEDGRRHVSQGSREHTSELLRKAIAHDSSISWVRVPDPSLVALLWHENVPRVLGELRNQDRIKLYWGISRLMCVGDIVDRILFQRQLRDSSHITLFLKCGSGGQLLAMHLDPSTQSPGAADLDFTKVLTKYSTSYNNSVFMAKIAAQLTLDYYEVLEQFAGGQEPAVGKISESDGTRIRKFITDCNRL